MARDSETFRWICEALEEKTPLTALAARGTIRLALRKGGLDSATVDPQEMTLVLSRIMPRELEARGIEGGDQICNALIHELQTLEVVTSAPVNAPDAVFRRVFGH